jgi:hypothetical protein
MAHRGGNFRFEGVGFSTRSGAKKHLWKSQCQEDATVGSLVCVTVNITY